MTAAFLCGVVWGKWEHEISHGENPSLEPFLLSIHRKERQIFPWKCQRWEYTANAEKQSGNECFLSTSKDVLLSLTTKQGWWTSRSDNLVIRLQDDIHLCRKCQFSSSKVTKIVSDYIPVDDKLNSHDSDVTWQQTFCEHKGSLLNISGGHFVWNLMGTQFQNKFLFHIDI